MENTALLLALMLLQGCAVSYGPGAASVQINRKIDVDVEGSGQTKAAPLHDVLTDKKEN